jgi:hypothetical protein
MLNQEIDEPVGELVVLVEEEEEGEVFDLMVFEQVLADRLNQYVRQQY